MTSRLIEICCKCGFVHRDDRHARPMNKQRKLHYHWLPKEGEVVKNDFTLHATICVCCTEGDHQVNWKTYNEQRKKTSRKYYIKTSYNATIPDKYLYTFDELYSAQAQYFEVELDDPNGYQVT